MIYKMKIEKCTTLEIQLLVHNETNLAEIALFPFLNLLSSNGYQKPEKWKAYEIKTSNKCDFIEYLALLMNEFTIILITHCLKFAFVFSSFLLSLRYDFQLPIPWFVSKIKIHSELYITVYRRRFLKIPPIVAWEYSIW